MAPWNTEWLEGTDLINPLRVERSAPVGDEEAFWLERLCETATPGPLLIEDETDGEGVVVATLPDGRRVVSLSLAGTANEDEVIQANARLMCQARYMLQRFLRDRSQWQAEREQLLARISELEAAAEDRKRDRPRRGGYYARPR